MESLDEPSPVRPRVRRAEAPPGFARVCRLRVASGVRRRGTRGVGAVARAAALPETHPMRVAAPPPGAAVPRLPSRSAREMLVAFRRTHLGDAESRLPEKAPKRGRVVHRATPGRFAASSPARSTRTTRCRRAGRRARRRRAAIVGLYPYGLLPRRGRSPRYLASPPHRRRCARVPRRGDERAARTKSPSRTGVARRANEPGASRRSAFAAIVTDGARACPRSAAGAD